MNARRDVISVCDQILSARGAELVRRTSWSPLDSHGRTVVGRVSREGGGCR